MEVAGPSVSTLRAAVAAFGAGGTPEASWLAWTAVTAPAVDLSVAAHRKAAHTWLNAWGCRIRYPRPGEPDVFDAGLASWWAGWADALPGPDVALADLGPGATAELAACFDALRSTPAAQTRSVRTLGSTAAAKLLFALRPKALLPWDDLIAQRLHGARDGTAYAAHQRLGRAWALALLAEAGAAEDELCASLGRPGRSLAKLLDEYCYLVYTRQHRFSVTIDDVRRLALALPRTEEHLIRDRVKFRIGRIVYLALSRDETVLGFAFPKEERAALVAAEPDKFHLPAPSDMRYNWVQATLAELDLAELTELITEAWTMCVPKRVAAAWHESTAGS